MYHSMQFPRMNSVLTVLSPIHATKNYPVAEEHATSPEGEFLTWYTDNKDHLNCLATAIDEATQWIVSDKMYVAFSTVRVDEFDNVDDLQTVQNFFHAQAIWPGHPLFQVVSAKPSTFTLEDLNKIDLENPSYVLNARQCIATATLSDQHPLKGRQYLCLLTAVGEGDWEDESFQVSFLFIRLAESKYPYICSFRAEFPQDVSEFRKALWSLCDTHDLSRTIVATKHHYQFPTLEPFVEIQSTSVTMEDVRGLLEKIDDSHVMLETLRPVPLNENSMERDHGGS